MPLRLVRHPKRSPHWYIRGTVRGQSVFETTGTDDAKIADARRIRLESELLERSVFGVGKTVTFRDAVNSYLAGGGEDRFLVKHDRKTGKFTLLMDDLAGVDVAKIDQVGADEACKKLYPKCGAATRKRQFYIPLCAVLNHAAKRKWCPRPMIEHPHVPEAKTSWSSPDRLAKLLPHCAPQMRRFLIMSVYTGARLSEILRVNWDDDVDLSMRAIVFRRTKNGKMRTVHIADPLLIELSRVPENERHGPLFAWTNKRSVHPPLRSACKRAGVPYLPPHQQGRHTYATWLRMFAGVDLAALKEAGGWDSLRSVERYLHVAPGEAARAVDRLPSVQISCSNATQVSNLQKKKKNSA